MYTRQSQMAIWDMSNTLFLTTVAVEPTQFCCFPLALANIFPWPLVLVCQISFEEQLTPNHSQYLSRLSRALFPTTFLEIAVYRATLGYAARQGIPPPPPPLNFRTGYQYLKDTLIIYGAILGYSARSPASQF